MFSGWTIAGILLLAVVLILTIIFIGTVGIYVSEGVPLSSALSRATMTAFGADKGPKHEMFALFYYPLVYLGMLFVSTGLLAEVVSRK